MAKRATKDRISQLPSEILIHILSFLTLNEATRTSVLSKRWIDLWICVARLDFDAFEVLERLSSISGHQRNNVLENMRSKYVKWVNKALQSHNVTPLDELRICFQFDQSSQNEIDKWVHHAFSRKVQRLELINLIQHCHDLTVIPKLYAFPHGLLGLSNGRTSDESPSGFCGHGIHMRPLNGFESLRSLRLSDVNVTGDILKIFLQKFPFLEHLVVNGSRDLRSVEVRGSSLALRHLDICHCPLLKSIIVCDTNLVSLKITACFVQNLVFKNVTTLVDLWAHGFRISKFVSLFSCCLSNLEVLSLFFTDLDIRRDAKNVLEVPQLTKLKHLIIIVIPYADEGDSPIPYTSLIRASPNLEKFVLKLVRFSFTARIKSEFEKPAAGLPNPHLKVVEILGYFGRYSEDELVEYILENAVALARIVIDARDQLIFSKVPLKQPELEKLGRSNAKKLREKVMLTSPSVDVVLL